MSMVRIAVCNRRTDKKYKNKELEWEYIKERNRKPVRTSETAEEYPKLPKKQRDELKDIGGLVGGWLKEGVRKNGCVLFRSLGLLDADYVPPNVDFPGKVKAAFPDAEYFIYSTHSHTKEEQRYRLVILFSREVSEDEYPAVMRMAAKQLDLDWFDDCTYESNRMMYWASCPSNGEFVFEEQSGTPLDPDKYLGMYIDWRDASQWPTSSRQSEVIKRETAKQQNPLEKNNMAGVFCRAYPNIEEIIETFLSDVYRPSAVDGRYDYIPGESSAGVVIYDGVFAYSHHATDPACGKLLNGFDLVRLHKFGDDDEKKSYMAMSDFIVKLDKVKIQIDEERRAALETDFSEDGDWRGQLQYQSRSRILENSVWNEMLILNNDRDFANFAFNEMAHRVEITGTVPWDRPEGNKFWRDADTAQMKAMIDVRYVPFSSRNHDVAFTKVADDRHFHPVRDYLDALPAWDGKLRCDALLVRYFNANDTRYVRAVTRKTLTGAVARIYRPGTKFDSMLVLDGLQGIGKSTLPRMLAGDEFYSETLSLTDMSDKTGAEKLQGFWIVEIAELAGMKKADIEKVKAFLSTSDDKYRPSYGKTVESHPRQCVIIGSVNGERGYLRDITGNRRFWVVKLNQEEQQRKWRLSPEERDQIWAEAKHYYEQGEPLYLEEELIADAEAAQRDAMESDDRQGMVEEYLNTLLPEDWDGRDLYARREYLGGDFGSPRDGTIARTQVSNAEVWCECFGRGASDLKPADSYALAALMAKINGWERSSKIAKLPIYGRQRLYLKR